MSVRATLSTEPIRVRPHRRLLSRFGRPWPCLELLPVKLPFPLEFGAGVVVDAVCPLGPKNLVVTAPSAVVDVSICVPFRGSAAFRAAAARWEASATLK